jgi:MFS family permease
VLPAKAGGGVLAQYASWRWIFAVGAVLVAAATVLVVRLVPATFGQAGGRYDWRGIVALSVAAITLLVALTLVVSNAAAVAAAPPLPPRG